MTLKCLACQQPTTEEQPYYCLQCFIPVSPYQEDTYIVHEKAFCPQCDKELVDRDRCHECGFQLDLPNPPEPGELSKKLKIRNKNRSRLAQEVLSDSRMIKQVIDILGIGHLPRAQQGVALTALSKEKMNFLSIDYNFTEAHTLVDMGYAIAKEEGEEWAIQITGIRLATIYIRIGNPLQAAKLLTELYQKSPVDNQIQQFRQLEILAYLALAHRLAGNETLADQASDQAHETLLTLFQGMEQQIHDLVQDPDLRSEYIGLDETGASFPRVDYVCTILVILTEEAIVRGANDPYKVSDLVIDRMLELNNIIKILGQISPKDDPGYFASHLRDYIRLANGLLWYGDVLLPNSSVRRHLLIEEYFKRILQWDELLEPQQWLSLRPARFLEIFIRSSEWSEEIIAEELIEKLLQNAPREVKANWHYVMADTYSKLGKLDRAIEHLDVILQEQADYIAYADDELKILAQQLFNSIQLESVGILVGVADDGGEWLNFPVSIQLEGIREPVEPAVYLESEFKPPVLRLSFDRPPVGPQIGIFGDRLLDMYDALGNIIQAGKRDYDSDKWHSPSGADKPIEGERTDLLVIRSEIGMQTISLLFEGRPQHIKEEDEKYVLQPSDLLLLRGTINQEGMDLNSIINFLVELLAENPRDSVEIFTLKKKDTL